MRTFFTHAGRFFCAVLVLALFSCKGDGPTGSGGKNKVGPPARISAVSGDTQTGAVGSKLSGALVVKVTDAAGKAVSGAAVAWAVGAGGGSVSTATSTTDAAGEARVEWTLGTGTGPNSVTATVTGVAPLTFTAEATAGPAARIEKVSGDGQTANVTKQLTTPLAVRVTDAHGNRVSGAAVTWQVTAGGGSIAAASATTDATGTAQALWTLGAAAGANTATATAAGATVSFSATATTPGSLAVHSVSPATLTPGTTATLTGAGFAATVEGNTVTVDGVAATVTAATATQLTVTLPARTAFRCEPTRSVTVAVTVGGATAGRSHPLEVAVQRRLAVGEALFLSSARDSHCNELAQTGGRYVLNVINTSRSSGALTAFQLRGAGAAAYAASYQRGSAPVRPRLSTGAVPGADREAAHARLLEQNRELLRRLGPSHGGSGGARLSRAAANPVVGDTMRLRVGDITSDNYCRSFSEVTARVVYVGSRTVVLEDRAAALAGQMDADYASLGEEVDKRMLPILEANFGNPLAVDARTDANGKVLMLFTPKVNETNTAAGFVLSGDLFTRAQCSSSNQAEIFYALVPTSTAAGYTAGTRDQWNWTMRSTVIHEIKHITSFAERLARNATTWEESWLEESTARISEELWARAHYGYAWKGNVTHAQSMFCESRPTRAECSGKPLVMRKHFGGLYDYMSANETRTPLGRTGEQDASFYGSGWSLVRWAIDHFAASESDFLKALNQETSLSGLSNLEARTGRSYAEMLGHWSMALALDDAPGVTVSNPRLSLPSWNLRDGFAGLNRDFPNTYSSPYPLGIREVKFGAFLAEVPGLRGGTAAFFDLSGAQTGSQVVELRSVGGGEPASNLRLGIVRVQ